MSASRHQSQKSIKSASNILRTIGNERRFRIICYLLERELHVGKLAALIGISQSALSQHLKVLREDRLVSRRREGLHIYYSLAEDKVEMLRTIVETLCDADRSAVRRLRKGARRRPKTD